MAYLNFDKALLINLERSLGKEMIRTNRAGAYNSTTLVDCNTRKYHGQLVVPLNINGHNDNYVLLSSLDETVVQHGAEFNLGVHKYGEQTFVPNGHKYIREFDCSLISKTTYRVGGVILTKERLLASFEPRVLIRYTLQDAASPIALRLTPFLAYRNVNELTHENGRANSEMQEIENGRVCRMYDEFPQLFMQLSRKCSYVHQPHWYKGIEYQKEQERGYEYKEDQLVPGYFELNLKKGESVIFTAGISEFKPSTMKSVWEQEVARRMAKNDMLSWLKNSASQFYKRVGDKCYLLAGYPWFKATAREEFFSVCVCTMGIGRENYWKAIVDDTAVGEINNFITGKHLEELKIEGMDEPDALLWFIRTIQEYSYYAGKEKTAQLYGELCMNIIQFYRKQNHPRAFIHGNGLLWVDGIDRPATWMNAVENGKPITPRTGYVVEINALWYNAMRFTAELMRHINKSHQADMLDYQAEMAKSAFVNMFWNGIYLDDYVVDSYHNKEVRPNQLWAVSLPYSPLDKKQQKAVLDICTKELYTPKGLRTLSPKSGTYRPIYIGGQLERDRNFHNGPVWPFSIAAYAKAYLKVYQYAGESFIRRLLVGYEVEMSELCIGTLNELYDGNPPYKGHGGMSYAPSVSAVISVINTLKDF